MSDNNGNIEVPVLLWPLSDLSVNEDVIEDRKQEELAESAEERLKQDEELAKRIKEEGFNEVYAEQEGEYLVEGALLTCSLATKKALVIQGDTYESGMKETGSIFERPEAVSRLKVNPKKESFNGCAPANIYDSKKIINICPFGNCMSMLTSKDVSIIKGMGELAKQTGICQCLMNLNKEWENLPSLNEADLFEFPSEEDEEKPYGITRTSILFCKRGGIISALTSGQKPNDLDETEQFIKEILETLGWPIDNSELHELKAILDDFGINDKNSIACFLLICRSESGEAGLYLNKRDRNGDLYVDQYGRAVTEYYPVGYKVAYLFEERGVGYIQVTWKDTQLKCIKDLQNRGYYTGNINSNALGYVNELRDMPWVVSAWRWAEVNQTGDGNLNNYVAARAADNGGQLTIGIVLAAESFINGKVSAQDNPAIQDTSINTRPVQTYNTVSDAIGAIARGNIADWEVINGELHVAGWIYEAPNNWTEFESNYKELVKNGVIK